jgi:hypothetical protein
MANMLVSKWLDTIFKGFFHPPGLVVEEPGHPASSEAQAKHSLIVGLIVPDGFKGTEVNDDSSKLRDGPYNE